jgi:hypothetical protein
MQVGRRLGTRQDRYPNPRVIATLPPIAINQKPPHRLIATRYPRFKNADIPYATSHSHVSLAQKGVDHHKRHMGTTAIYLTLMRYLITCP